MPPNNDGFAARIRRHQRPEVSLRPSRRRPAAAARPRLARLLLRVAPEHRPAVGALRRRRPRHAGLRLHRQARPEAGRRLPPRRLRRRHSRPARPPGLGEGEHRLARLRRRLGAAVRPHISRPRSTSSSCSTRRIPASACAGWRSGTSLRSGTRCSTSCPWAEDLVGSSRKATELYVRHFLSHWSHDKDLWSDEEIAEYVEAFSQPGAHPRRLQLLSRCLPRRLAARRRPEDLRSDAHPLGR